MSDFFVGLESSSFPHLHAYLSARYIDFRNANVETVLQAVEQSLDAPLSRQLRHEMMRGQDPRILKQELEQYCLKRLCFGQLDVENWAVKLLAHANHRTTVITTNYDLLADDILRRRRGATHCRGDATCHHCNMMAILREDCECGPPRRAGSKQNAALLKLHGSIAWHVCNNNSCSVGRCLVPRCDCKPIADPKCDCCGEKCGPAIVLPSMVKKYGEFPEIKRMWSRAESALLNAHTITVFGFSFPASDCIICEMFRATLSRTSCLRDILVLDIDPELVGARIDALLPHGSEVRVHPFRVPGDGSMPEWLT